MPTGRKRQATEPQVVAKEAAKDAFFGERHAWKQPVSSIVLYCEVVLKTCWLDVCRSGAERGARQSREAEESILHQAL